MTPVDQLHVDIARQSIVGSMAGQEVVRYPVSTAARGIGAREGSFQAPSGDHRVRIKLGAGLPLGAVFLRRRWTGDVLDPPLRERFPSRDWVLTRVLWLQGLEPDVNRGSNVDTLRRFVYIHGTHEEDLVGQPASFGCVRMRSADIAALFDRVPTGCRVRIE